MDYSFLKAEAKERCVPQMFPDSFNISEWDEYRQKLVEFFSENVYGLTPDFDGEVQSINLKEDKTAFAGKATHKRIMLRFDTPKGKFSFPIDSLVPNDSNESPLFIFLSFHNYKESYETPIEEIIDSGYALIIIRYTAITEDNDDFNSKLAGMFDRGSRPNEWGKIGMWAYALSRVMDYAQTLEYIDKDKIACTGHSRLGKTVLWCAAQDTRFAAVFANNSGCSGAALSRGKKGETIQDIVSKFPYWFCEKYRQYACNEDKMLFDSHQLLASIAPRLCYTCSAGDDLWADPESEYLSCVLAGKGYEFLGLKGLVGKDRYPKIGDVFHDGNIGYHMREGTHFLSRYDWQKFIEFMDKHTKGE